MLALPAGADLEMAPLSFFWIAVNSKNLEGRYGVEMENAPVTAAAMADPHSTPSQKMVTLSPGVPIPEMTAMLALMVVPVIVGCFGMIGSSNGHKRSICDGFRSQDRV